MEEAMRGGSHVPVLIITGNGEVKIQGINNCDVSDAALLPENVNFTISELLKNYSKALTSNNHALDRGSGESDRKAFPDLFFDSGGLEDFMEVCIIYKCKQCNYSSDNREEFQKHCLSHLLNESVPSSESTTYIYLCSHCNEAFNSTEETKKHMVHEHNFQIDDVPGSVNTINVSIETDNDAKIKNLNVKNKRKLGEIIESFDPSGKTGDLSYFCRKKNCKYKFKNEKDLDTHEKCHLDSELSNGKKRLYKCFNCNELFNGWHSCCSHLYKVHKIDCDLLKCPICETYRTSLPLRLENHIRIHSDVRAFTCKHCGKTFKQASQLRNHIVVHADKNGNQKPNWSKSKQCNICFKMYSDSKSLKKHKEEVHSKLRPFVCSVCGHASARKAMLLMHQRQHTGHKPHHCKLCNFKTADHNSLRKHLMRHTGVRPYKCPHCDYTAIQSGSYKNHMKIVHPNSEGMLICSICHYKTISEDNYIRHISDHLTGLIKGNLESDEISLNCVTNLFNVSHFIEEALNENSDKIEETSNEYLNQNECPMAGSGGITIPAHVDDPPGS